MDSPTDEQFNNDADLEPSDASSTGSPEPPFEPLFMVKVVDPIKDGEVVVYTIKSTTLLGDGEEYRVSRQYEDFEYLNHCLIANNDVAGLIVPPLPPKPVIEAKGAESKSKRQLGSSSKVLIGDEYHKDCRNLERYLKLVINHTVFGSDASLETFLTEKQAPARIKIKKGILGRISSVVEEHRKAGHRDIDEYFQRERDWANNHAAILKDASINFNKVIFSEQRIASAYGHLSTALNLGGGFQDPVHQVANRLLVKFSEALDDAKHGTEVDYTNDENTLGYQLDLFSRYMENVKDMLYLRTCLMVEYEDANRNLDRAKPQKKIAAEDAKMCAEKAFDECSEVARRELQTFHRQRRIALAEGMYHYAEAKVKTARDTYALLAKSLTAFKQFHV